MSECLLNGASAEALIKRALKARKNAYCPYSHYAVGACVYTAGGVMYDGCNVENASYGASNCAERTAVFRAVSSGSKRIQAVAIIGGPEEYTSEMPSEAFPCGICRQVIREFCEPDKCLIIVAKSINSYRVFKLSELLPESFGPENLEKQPEG